MTARRKAPVKNADSQRNADVNEAVTSAQPAALSSVSHPREVTREELKRLVHDACDSDDTNYYAAEVRDRDDSCRFYVESRDHFYRTTVVFRKLLLDLANGSVQIVDKDSTTA